MDDRYVTARPWRTGRKVGRTIYVVIGFEASDRDVLIGLMDTPGLARAVVEEHNELIHRGL